MGEQDEEIEKELSQFIPANSTGEATPAQSVTYEVDLSQLPPQVQQQVMSQIRSGSPGMVIAADDGQAPPDAPVAESSAAQAEPVALDDATVALATQAMRPRWYASWVTGLLIPAGPALGVLLGLLGGGVEELAWAELGVVFLVLFGPVIGLVWLTLFIGHRDRVRPIRDALDSGTAYSITGPIVQTGSRSIQVADQSMSVLHHLALPRWSRTTACTVTFATGQVGRGRYRPVVSLAIAILGADRRQLYPEAGPVPTILHVPAVIASVLLSLAFTAACNAQSQTYSAGAAYMRDINGSVPCTATSKPADDCTKWVQGTIAFDYWYQTSSVNGAVSSTCRATLRWAGNTQIGDVRTEGVDCTKQLTSDPMPAKLQVIKNFAIQVQVGATTYETDRWSPAGNGIFTLALVFQIATIVWVAWPIGHVTWAIVYRLWKAASPPQAAAVTTASSAVDASR